MLQIPKPTSKTNPLTPPPTRPLGDHRGHPHSLRPPSSGRGGHQPTSVAAGGEQRAEPGHLQPPASLLYSSSRQ